MTPESACDAVYPVSRETKRRLERLVDAVTRWQKTSNLVAPSTLQDIWSRHVADSLQCVALKPQSRNWLDLGSGGGFPGLVIAACMVEHEGASVTLVESNQKKAAFLRRAAREAGANATIVCDRIENLTEHDFRPEIVTARALAGLPQLLDWTAPWLRQGATALFHKGREYEAELAKCDGVWSFDLLCHESRITPDSVVLEISNLKPVGS